MADPNPVACPDLVMLDAIAVAGGKRLTGGGMTGLDCGSLGERSMLTLRSARDGALAGGADDSGILGQHAALDPEGRRAPRGLAAVQLVVADRHC